MVLCNGRNISICDQNRLYDGSMIAKLPQIDNSWNYMTLANLFYQVLLTKFYLDETEQSVNKKSKIFAL